ncbi:MAG: hypothetical protein J6U38_05025, partial [Clostridia bacterium]|nr:hypothetical protein [Clostridia bacterium]
FNEEFSRDIEMPKEGYGDNFYLQLCDNIRRFKGAANVKAAKTPETVIDVNADPSQWDNVTASYKALSQTVRERDSTSVDKRIKYKQPAPDNNIQEIKLAHDKENLYFLIRCENDVAVPDEPNWMNIYIGTGELSSDGFCGYEFLADCTPEGGKVCTLDNEGASAETGAGVKTSVSGKYVQVAVPLSALGIKNVKNCKGVYFKVTDGVNESADILETYISGKSLPMGRLSYYYYF